MVSKHQDILESVCRMGRLVFGSICLEEHSPSDKRLGVAVVDI